MEVKETRHIKSGEEYDHLFPESKLEVKVIKRNAKLEDTIQFLPKAISSTLYQTNEIVKELISELHTYSQFNICRRVWNWVYDHIQYRKDEPGKEQIQSPQYTWAVRAGDCDDYTVLISSILRHIKGLRVVLRIAMYNQAAGYQHIYPVAFLSDGSKVIMDCVAKKFNYEVPYIKKIDKAMELQFLNGLPEIRNNKTNNSVDAEDLLDGYEGDIGELGKGKLKAKIQNAKKKVQAKVKNTVQKVKNSKVVKAVKKGLHTVNRVNPAAALLRAGILTSMKTNLFKIAEGLRFSYLTPQQAQAKDFDMTKYNKLIGIRQKLEKIFFGSGGKVENLKAAILTGKGNRDKQVAGLGRIDYNEYTQQNTLQQILGIETYNAELNGVEGFGEVGVVAAAAVTSATTVLAAIAGLLKSLGNLRKNKNAKQGGEKESGGDTKESGSETNDTKNENPSGDNANDNNAGDNSNQNPNADNGEPSNSGGETTSSSDANENNSSSTSDDATTEGSPKSNGGGGANKSSNAKIPNATNKAEGSDNSGSGAEGSSENSGTDEPAGKGEEENNNGAGTNAVKKAATEESFKTKAMNWAKENPVPATGIAIVVLGGLTFGLIKLFAKDDKKEKNKHKETVSGLPHTKKQFHSHKITIQKLR